MTNAEQNIVNELNRISRQVHDNHKLIVFIANRFRANPDDLPELIQAGHDLSVKTEALRVALEPQAQQPTEGK